MMNKRTFLQAFIIHLQLNHISFRETEDNIYATESNPRYFMEFLVYENGTYEALVTDLVNGTFPVRQKGEWQDANDLKEKLQSYRNILKTG